MKYATVAISTCPPDLEPIFIIDINNLAQDREGRPKVEIGYVDKWIKWMESQGVKVVNHRLSFAQTIIDHHTPARIDIALGAFLRCDIPIVCEQLGIKDQYVFYSDTDVIFINPNVDYINQLKPEFVAASVEFNPNDWSYFNSGVMVINTSGLKSLIPDIISKIPTHGRPTEDQSVLNAVIGNRWLYMLVEYNWKAYWTRNHNETLIHFHGPKPFTPANHWPSLKYGAWDYWNNVFHEKYKHIGII
jgi:hypothetical protein